MILYILFAILFILLVAPIAYTLIVDWLLDRKYNLRSGGPITHGDTEHNSVLDRECTNLYVSAASIEL